MFKTTTVLVLVQGAKLEEENTIFLSTVDIFGLFVHFFILQYRRVYTVTEEAGRKGRRAHTRSMYV